MKKGNFGISLSVIALLAYVFGILGMSTAVLLVVAFALLAEKDEWLNKQVIGALFLTLAYDATTFVINTIFNGIIHMFNFFKIFKPVEGLGKANLYINDAFYIVFIILFVIAMINLLNQKDANIPVINNIVDKAFGIVNHKQSQSAEWTCSCGTKNIGDFCSKCGSPKK